MMIEGIDFTNYWPSLLLSALKETGTHRILSIIILLFILHKYFPKRVLLAASKNIISFGKDRLLPRGNQPTTDNNDDTDDNDSTGIYGEFNFDDYSSYIAFIAMDCEMVGVGRNGKDSVLARCSLVTLVKDADSGKDVIRVVYDAYVKPSRHITDYRTQYSGITKHRLQQDDVITLHECRMNVLSILSSSSDGGKKIVLVGHALRNDFDVLGIKHPRSLTRDTATYSPLMRPVRKRFYPRKLSELSKEYLALNIQNSGICTVYESINGDKILTSSIGHDSIEDAAATLMLYKKFSYQWEKSLDFPLRKFVKQDSPVIQRRSRWMNNPIKSNDCNSSKIPKLMSSLSSAADPKASLTLYLDGCNIPIGLRQRKEGTVRSENKFQLLAFNGDSKRTPIDWIPLLQSMISCSSFTYIPSVGKIHVYFDGKMYSKQPQNKRPSVYNDLGHGLHLNITNESTEVDDVLVKLCKEDRDNDKITIPKKDSENIIDIDKIIDDLKDGLTENALDCKSTCKYYYVVRRKGGGKKTNKKLFDELKIRRAEEGAFCLLPSLIHGNPRLHKNSIQIAKKLQRAKVHHVVEYERRHCQDIRSIVVTDDVLLSDRVVKEGGVVMRYSQLRQLI